MPTDSEGPPKSTLPTSCQTCRLRKIRCQPSPEGSDSTGCQACVRKGINCVYVERSRTRNRSGKNVETARARYGSVLPNLTLSSASTSSTDSSPEADARPCVASQDALVRQHLASSLGAKLFELWLNRDPTRSTMPNVDLPVVDFWDLLSKHSRHGYRLDKLDPVDEVLCRLTYAFAAPIYLPDRLAGNTRRNMVAQLMQDAESRADELVIWRRVDITHVPVLLLLYRAKATETAASPDAVMYLSAAVAQFRQLTRANKLSLHHCDEAFRAMGWSLIVYDTLGAAESRQRPNLSREELETLLPSGSATLPTAAQLSKANPHSGQSAMSLVMQSVHVVARIAYDTAMYTSGDTFSVEDCTGLWVRIDEVYRWARSTLFEACTSATAGGSLIRVYTHVLWVAALALEMSIIQHLSEMITQAATSNARICGLQDTEHLSNLVTMCGHANQRLSRALCAFLRLPQEQPHETPQHTLSVAPGVVCSVSRVLDLANAFVNAPASDQTLFPLGAWDKLASLRHLEVQLRYLSRGYPSAHMTATLAALDAESAILSAMTVTGQAHDTSVPPPAEPPLVPSSDDGATTSAVPANSTFADTISLAEEPLLSPRFFTQSLFDPSLSDYPSDLGIGSSEGAWRWEMV
ncbi:hypothetical protein JCM10908_007240 [Rhodotorula pacifica]|uniref:uncharacterized protein n=1 Tax=Rhodotorula pacifica TaxID=1495444 RepID=UPI0031764B87